MNIFIQLFLFGPLLLEIFHFQHKGICAATPKLVPNATEKDDPFANLRSGVFLKSVGQNQEQPQLDTKDDEIAGEKDAFKNTTKGKYNMKVKEVKDPKMFFYDKFGILMLNGSVSGVSNPIVLDYKKYWPKCSTNVHFFFTLKVPDEKTVDTIKSISRKANLTLEDKAEMLSSCLYGITFCYEGQLDGPSIRDEFRVTNFVSEKEDDLSRPSQKVGFQCMLATDSPTTHGFNLAVVAFPGLENVKIGNESQFENKFTIWRFLMFTMSIVKEEYYFEIPKNGQVMLQIGDRQSFRSYLVNSNGKMLKQASFRYKGKTYGEKTMQEDFIIPEPQEYFSDHRGFWMLYMDFKRSYNELQIIKTIHSEDCQMMVEIHGNRMKKCRTYFEDIAVTEASDVELDLMYTFENGNIHRNDHGQEDLVEMLRRMEKEDLRKKTTKEMNETKLENSNATTSVNASSHVSQNTTETKHYYGGGVSANIGYSKSDQNKSNEANNTTDGSGEKTGQENGKKAVNQNAGKNITKEAEKKSQGPLTDEKKKKAEKTQSAWDILKDVGKTAVNKSIEAGNAFVQQGLDSGSAYVKTQIDTAINGPAATPAPAGETTRFPQLAPEGIPNQKEKLNEQIKLAQDLLEQKTGQVGLGLASLMARSRNGATEMFGEFGTDLMEVVNKGAEKIEELTARMQNLVPPSFGGSLSTTIDRTRALMPTDVSSKDFLNPEPPKLPKEGIKLPRGQKLTNEFFQQLPEGVRIPSSWAEYEAEYSMFNNSYWWNEKIRSTGGDIATRVDLKMKHGDDSPSQFVRRHKRAIETEAWTNAIKNEEDKLFAKNENVVAARRHKRAINVHGNIDANKEHGNREQKTEGGGKYEIDNNSNRAFNHVSTSRSMMESFKHTSGITNSLTSADFIQYSQTFSHKEAVDIHVSNLPKNTKIVISQLIFECDGNVMKLPKLFFHDTKEILEGFVQNALGVQSIGDVNAASNLKGNPLKNITNNGNKTKEKGVEDMG